MQSFKGLISRNLVSQQSMGTINKKTQQFRRISLQSSQISISLLKIYEIYLLQLSRIMSLLLEETSEQESYYKVLKNIYSQIYKQYHHFILDYLQTPSNQITNSNSLRYINFSGCVLTFQKQMKNYSSSQASMIELGKKYFKSQKNLLNSIQAYKQSFTQAKLIYNMDQKIRRYSACEQNFKNVQQDHAFVDQAKEKLMVKKKQVIQTFQLLSKQMSLHQNQINAKTFLFLSKFNINLTQNLKRRLIITKQGRKKIQSLKVPNFFQNFNLDQNIMFLLSQGTNDAQSRRRKANMSNLTAVGINAQNNLQTLKRLYARLQKHIQVTKHQNLIVYQFHVQFYKSAEKKSIAQLKQSLSNFEKNKKKIKQQFTKPCYDQFKNTLQIIKVTMDVYSQVQKKIGNKLQYVHENIQQLKSILQKVLQEISTMIQKMTNNSGNKEKQVHTQVTEYKQKILQITGIIKTADERLSNIMSHIKQSYSQILNIYELGVNQSYDRCQQFSKISREKQEQMLTQIRQNKYQRLRSTIFLDLLSDQNRGNISFEDQAQKNSDFKKLKKPVQIEVLQKDKEKQINIVINSTTNSTNKQQIQKDQFAGEIDDQNPNSPQKYKKKYKEFLQSKFSFVQGQEFLSTFSCALADKIILQGRLYVTTHRICFYSSFNPSTVFFRQTFIQVPKKDIITLQKRKNGIFFDNSISITTKNGELFLTSFFKRNQAFKVVSQLIGLNTQQQAYQHQNAFQSDTSEMGSPQKQRILKMQQVQANQQPLQMQNDLKQQSLPQRSQAIQNILNLSPYVNNFKQCASLTAYKLLKVLLLEGQITMQGKKFNNFSQYFKKIVLGHKDVQSTSFQPIIKQHLNPSNITQGCPVKFLRKLTSTAPTPSSGIPFMPKWAKTMQNQTLHIISKHKWVLDTQLENSGAPYTDSFKVYYRTICESSASYCRIVTSIHINFTKSVMVRGIIQSKTQQQSKSQLTKQYEQLKKYLLTQDKQRSKKLKLINLKLNSNANLDKKDQQAQNQLEQLQANEQKIKQLEDKIQQINAKHENQVQKIRKEIKTYQLAIGILILLSVFLQVVL